MNNLIDKNLLEKYNDLVKNDSLLPIKLTDFYKKKVIEEVEKIGIGGPLYKSVIPTMEKLTLKTSIETRDYVEEEKHMPVASFFSSSLFFLFERQFKRNIAFHIFRISL